MNTLENGCFSPYDFPYDVSEIKSFIGNLDNFTLLMTNGELVSFTTDHPDDFRKWLQENDVKDVLGPSE
jgi:hypothetical protein